MDQASGNIIVTLRKTALSEPQPPAPEPEQDYHILRVPITGMKKLQGGLLKAGQFHFLLKDSSGKVLARVSNEQDGRIHFPERSFSRMVSNYLYTIVEEKSGETGISYDDTVYTLKVSTRAKNGELVAELNLERDGTPYAGDLVFTNTRLQPKTGDGSPILIMMLAALGLLSLAGAKLLRRRMNKAS